MAITTNLQPTLTTINKVCREVEQARTKWPGTEHLLAALTEELGELAQAMLQARYEDGDPDRIEKEAVQVACVAIRIIEEGDATFDPQHVLSPAR